MTDRRYVRVDANIQTIALVGASERSFYCRMLVATLRSYGYDGDLYPIHPKADKAFGLRAYASVEELPVVPDIGVVLLRAEKCLGAVESLADIGCRRVIVVSDGFAETGDSQGALLQEELSKLCQERGVTLLGPNCIGFGDFRNGRVLLAAPLPVDLQVGPVTVVSQSGAILYSILAGLQYERVGIDLALSIGNGSGLDIVDAIEAGIDRAETRVVCGYVEGFGDDIARLERVLERAQTARKLVVLLKAGTSETSQKLAMSHTASIAGPDRYVEALFLRYGVVRVSSVEDLARTVKLVDHALDAEGRGVFIVTSTGGGASIASDLAASYGVRMAELAVSTERTLAEMIPKSGFLGNPMDLSGQVVGGAVSVGDVYDALFTDESIGSVMFVGATGFPDDSDRRAMHREQLEDIADKANEHGKKLIVSTVASQPWTEWISEFVQRRPGTSAVSGLQLTIAALGRLEKALRIRVHAAREPALTSTANGTPLSEADGRAILRSAGFAVVPGVVCDEIAEVPLALEGLKFPVVAKGVLPGVSHKAAIGGVALGLCDVSSVVAACLAMRDRLGSGEAPALHGFLIEEMVSGIELLFGLTREASYGPAVTLGLGGVLAEVTDMHATMLLPIDGADLGRLVEEAGVDRLFARMDDRCVDQLFAQILGLCDAFADGTLSRYSTIEVNPLFVTRDGRGLAGDVLVI